MNKARFYTKIDHPKENYTQYNNQIVDVLKCKSGKDIYSDRYTIKFKDGKIATNIMSCELDFEEEF